MTSTLTRAGSVVVPPVPPDPEPLRGDPEAALASARRCLAAAQSLHDAQVRLTHRREALITQRRWCGTASSAFQRSSSETASWFDNAGRALAVVAAALVTYAGAVDQAGSLLRQGRLRADELRRRRVELLAEIERAQAVGLGSGLLFDLATFDPATVALQRRADALADEIRDVRAAVAEATALAERADQTAAAAFDEAAGMTLAARARLLAQSPRVGARSEAAGSPWLDVGELIGLGLTDLAVGAVDAVQGGLDPLTDAAEVASVTRTGEVASRLAGRFAVDEAVAGTQAAAVQAAEREALAAVEQAAAGDDWLAAARAKLPAEWGDGIPGKYGTGRRWIEPEGRGTYLRIDPGRPNNADLLQQVDHVHVRLDGAKIGRDGLPVPANTPGLSPAEQARLAELEHVPLSEWLTWKDWWRP